MRLDHVSFAAGPDGLASTAQRIGGLLGTDFINGGVHPRFGTRNMILPLAGGIYMEIVEVLDHPASDKAPFGQAVRARSALGGGWMGWVVSVDDMRPVEARLGREAVKGNRHRPDGTELLWQQIGVNGLISDPQLPYFISWDARPSCTPATAPPATSRWPAWRSPATRSGSASGSARPSRRRSRTSRSSGSPPTAPPASSPSSCRPRTASFASERGQPAPPASPNIWNTPELYELENRAADPHGRIEAAMREIGDWSRPHVPRHRLRHRLPPARCGRLRASGHRRRAAPSAGRAGETSYEAAGERHRAQGHGPVAARAGRLGRRGARPVGLLLRPGLASPGCASSTGSMRRGGTAFVIDNDPTRSTFGGWFRRGYPEVDPVAVERFWSMHGWSRTPIDMGWSFESRADLEAVVRIELQPRGRRRGARGAHRHRRRLRGQPVVAALLAACANLSSLVPHMVLVTRMSCSSPARSH